VDAFCELYAVRPIESITIKEVVAIAGCNRTTFYQHFGSIYDVLDAVEQDALARITESMGSISVEVGHIEGFPGAFLALCKSNADLFALLLQGSGSHHFKARLQERIRPIVEANLAVAADGADHVPGYLADFYIAGVIAVVSSCIAADDEAALEQAARTIDGILRRGIIPTAMDG
jgi:AcrR family transcriptional regulator